MLECILSIRDLFNISSPWRHFNLEYGTNSWHKQFYNYLYRIYYTIFSYVLFEYNSLNLSLWNTAHVGYIFMLCLGPSVEWPALSLVHILYYYYFLIQLSWMYLMLMFPAYSTFYSVIEGWCINWMEGVHNCRGAEVSAFVLFIYLIFFFFL